MTHTNRRIPSLRELLPLAERGRYAIGSFAPRYPQMIRPIVDGAAASRSPAIVQISQKDIQRCKVDLAVFASTFFGVVEEEGASTPVALHLDHTEDVAIIHQAIELGFSSVMIDASDKPLEDNIAITRRVVEHAAIHGVSVEAELGTIGAAGFSETDESHHVEQTDPELVAAFVDRTGIDALAVSIGTIHGVDRDRPPTIDLDRLQAIRDRTPAHLVLHGGSGVSKEVMARAIGIRGGGVSKVNIATDLELALLQALERKERMLQPDVDALSEDDIARAGNAVRRVVEQKIVEFFGSAGRAHDRRSVPADD